MSEPLMLALAEQDVPQGYKKTEVGVIPVDWDLSDIRSISAVPMQNGLFYEPKRKGAGVPLINVSDMYKSAPIDVDILELFDATPNEAKSFRVTHGDLFFTRSSVVPSGIAFCNILESSRNDVVFDSHLIRVRPNRAVVDPTYLYLNCISKHARTSLISEAKTATMTTIDQGAINRCPVVLPPLKEQTAIATALSNVDALITTLEKLIAKKQAIKTATMQQLLTGRTRLPQFALRDDGTPKGYKASELGEIPEDWEVKTLGEVAKINMGQSPNSSFYNNKAIGFPLVQGNADIANRKTIVRNYTSQVTKMAKKGDLILSVRAPVGEVAKADFDCCIGRGVCALGYKNAYLYHWLVGFEAEWDKFSKGSTFDSINSDELRLIQLILPSFEEQTAIATILSNMDSDIDRLQQQLNKTRQIKQGMMQELLTGKTRLKV
jgi:type I restriction enzyme S subunit